MQGQGGGALMLSVVVHWMCRPLDFPGGAGQGLPPPVFFSWPPCMSYKKKYETSASCAVPRDSPVKPNCESRLATSSAGPRTT